MAQNKNHNKRTLWLCGALHAFTHIYHVALIPLYLLIQKDLKLNSVEASTLLVTVMGIAYFLPSYLMGILADRVSRKKLLTAGLMVNGLGFVGLSFAPNYSVALVCVVIAGLGGSFYHPSATALVARLYPIGTGKALGMVGIGASAGFFIGPLYAGWRAMMAGSWRAPILELGLFGMVAAGIFYWLSEEDQLPGSDTKPATSSEKLFPRNALMFFFVAAAVSFSLRDFAGSGMGSLASLFLQQAHGFTPKMTGLALGGMFLASAISNPIFGGLSDRGRMRWTSITLLAAAAMIVIFPHVPPRWIFPVLAIYGFFFMASYPMVEAAVMESVHDSVRGRVFGLFITFGGLIGNLSHWAVGSWVKNMGANANSSREYFWIFGLLAGFIVLSLVGLPCLQRIRQKEILENISASKPVLTEPTL
ncbi:MAG: MFS transporter [Verrucomicrobiota bacterium]